MADGLKGREIKLLKINTGTDSVPVYTDLEKIKSLTMTRSRDTWDNDDFDELVFKKEGVGNMTVTISGSYKFVSAPGTNAPAQAALRDAFFDTGYIKVQFADEELAGQPLYTVDMNITELTEDINDPVVINFSLSLRSSVVESTQS